MLLETLSNLRTVDLADILSVLRSRTEEVVFAKSSTQLALEVLEEAARVSGYRYKDIEGLERHIVCRLANALTLDYESSMGTEEILHGCYKSIAKAVVEDMRPFIQVCVCMGWADGKISMEEIQIMDAALSQLHVLRPFRSQLLDLCRKKIEPSDLIEPLKKAAGDEQKTWALLGMGWATALADRVAAEPEIRVYHLLAGFLEVSSDTADRIRNLVTKRFEEKTASKRVASSFLDIAQTAVEAAGLDHYLQAATGLRTLSSVLNRRLEGVRADMGGHKSDWILAPALVAGTLFIRSLRERPGDSKLVLMALLMMEQDTWKE